MRMLMLALIAIGLAIGGTLAADRVQRAAERRAQADAVAFCPGPDSWWVRCRDIRGLSFDI